MLKRLPIKIKNKLIEIEGTIKGICEYCQESKLLYSFIVTRQSDKPNKAMCCDCIKELYNLSMPLIKIEGKWFKKKNKKYKGKSNENRKNKD